MTSRSFEDWNRFERVLCVRPDNLGDVLMTTPAIRALKEARPERHVTLLTSHSGAAIARHVPEIDKVITFDPPWYRHESSEGLESLTMLVQTLHAGKFDAAIIFTVFSQNPLPTAMLCYQAGIPRIAGYCRENPYELLTDWVPDTEPLYGARHEVQRQLDLVTSLGAVPRASNLSLRVPAGQADKVKAGLVGAGVDPDRSWLLLHPGASEARRRYPAGRFAQAARTLHERLGVQVVLTGTHGERELTEDIARTAGEGTATVAGMFGLDELINLVAMAPLLVSNNTGPVHIAAAVQTPAVVLYALTNPQHAPWRVPHRVLPFDVPEPERSRNVMVQYASEKYFRRPAGMASADEIVEAADELLNGAGTAKLPSTGLVALQGGSAHATSGYSAEPG